MLRDYRQGRGVPLSTRLAAIALVAISISVSAFLAVPEQLWPLRLLLAGISPSVVIHIGRLY